MCHEADSQNPERHDLSARRALAESASRVPDIYRGSNSPLGLSTNTPQDCGSCHSQTVRSESMLILQTAPFAASAKRRFSARIPPDGIRQLSSVSVDYDINEILRNRPDVIRWWRTIGNLRKLQQPSTPNANGGEQGRLFSGACALFWV